MRIKNLRTPPLAALATLMASLIAVPTASAVSKTKAVPTVPDNPEHFRTILGTACVIAGFATIFYASQHITEIPKRRMWCIIGGFAILAGPLMLLWVGVTSLPW